MRTIRRASPENAAVILAIQKRAFEEEARICGTWEIPPLTEPVEDIVEHIETATVLIARRGIQVVGSVRGLVSDEICTIRGLSIEPACQGRGIGSALLSAIEHAHPHVARFELVTNSVMESNVRFYQRHGYRITGLRHYSDRIALAHMSKATGFGHA
jgi:ribosomal protein S18 acetylase RimI-like enzyme